MTVAPKTDLALFRSASGAVEKATARRGVNERLKKVRGASKGRAIVARSSSSPPTTSRNTRATELKDRPNALTPRRGSRTRDTTASPASTNRFGSAAAR